MARINKALRKALTGISGILVTPFDAADAIAPARLKPIVDRAVSAGVHVLVANGNTGEFYALSTQEAEAMVHAAAEHIDRRVPLTTGEFGGVGRETAWRDDADLGDTQCRQHVPGRAGDARVFDVANDRDLEAVELSLRLQDRERIQQPLSGMGNVRFAGRQHARVGLHV